MPNHTEKTRGPIKKGQSRTHANSRSSKPWWAGVSRTLQNGPGPLHRSVLRVNDGCLYGSNGGNGGGYLVCLDFKTGDVLWNERDSDKRRASKGSVAFADGRIYYRTEAGTMLLIEPSRKGYLELGRFDRPYRTRQPASTPPGLRTEKLVVR